MWDAFSALDSRHALPLQRPCCRTRRVQASLAGFALLRPGDKMIQLDQVVSIFRFPGSL